MKMPDNRENEVKGKHPVESPAMAFPRSLCQRPLTAHTEGVLGPKVVTE